MYLRKGYTLLEIFVGGFILLALLVLVGQCTGLFSGGVGVNRLKSEATGALEIIGNDIQACRLPVKAWRSGSRDDLQDVNAQVAAFPANAVAGIILFGSNGEKIEYLMDRDGDLVRQITPRIGKGTSVKIAGRIQSLSFEPLDGEAGAYNWQWRIGIAAWSGKSHFPDSGMYNKVVSVSKPAERRLAEGTEPVSPEPEQEMNQPLSSPSGGSPSPTPAQPVSATANPSSPAVPAPGSVDREILQAQKMLAGAPPFKPSRRTPASSVVLRTVRNGEPRPKVTPAPQKTASPSRTETPGSNPDLINLAAGENLAPLDFPPLPWFYLSPAERRDPLLLKASLIVNREIPKLFKDGGERYDAIQSLFDQLDQQVNDENRLDKAAALMTGLNRDMQAVESLVNALNRLDEKAPYSWRLTSLTARVNLWFSACRLPMARLNRRLSQAQADFGYARMMPGQAAEIKPDASWNLSLITMSLGHSPQPEPALSEGGAGFFARAENFLRSQPMFWRDFFTGCPSLDGLFSGLKQGFKALGGSLNGLFDAGANRRLSRDPYLY